MTRRPVLLLGLLTLAAAQGTCMSAQAGEPPSSAPPLRYRRVLVPQEQLADHTRGYLPIKREEFSSLLAQIEAHSRSRSVDAAWIQSAEYHAIYADGQLLSGTAVLQVAHAADVPAVLSLAPWGLAIGAGTWQSGETAQGATVGTDAAGNLLAMVRESGNLHLPWTLRGTTNEWGECRFELSLAAAPMSRVIIDVPSGFEVSADRGMVSPPANVEGATAATAAASVGLHAWVLQLGGHARCALTVAPRQRDRRRQQLVSVQQDTTYRLVDDGLEIACDIGLDIHREPLAELRLDVDAEVQITAVRLGNADVNWSSVPSEDGRRQTVRVQFAERLTGVHSTLQLLAVGPLRTDTSWRLPAFRPQDVFWRQGTMSLVVPETLELRHLTALDARQSSVAAAPEGVAGEKLTFELFGVDGALETSVSRRPREIVAEVGTTIDLDSGAVSAQTLADLRCRFGERFVVEAQVPNAWTIDGIDADPTNALNDYQIVAYEVDHRRLQIQLVHPLAADKAIRLKIRAHRSPSFPMAVEDIRPVEFLDVSYASRLVAVAPETNYRLELEGDNQLVRVDPGGLSPADAGRIQPRTGGVVFVDNEQASQLNVNITREDPEFAAAVYADTEVDKSSFVESYRITCTPDSTPVARLRIHLSETRTTDLPWQFIGDGNALLDAHRVSEEPGALAGLDRTGETWEIELRTPQGTPFEIRGQRTTRTPTALTASLATLPAAVSHEGRLTIRSMDGTRLSLKASAVKPIPCEPSPPGSYPTSRASYRFDASHNARVVIDRAQPRGDGATLWVWNFQLTSQYLATGEAEHVATFLLESGGGTELQVRLPAGCAPRGLEINGLDASHAIRSAADGVHAIALPAGHRFPRVDLAYGEVGRPLGFWSRLATEFPQVNVPVMDRRWSVWLPPGYRPAWFGRSSGVASDDLPSWKQRLLGPLSARSDTQPFRLFSREDWSAALGDPDPRRTGAATGQILLELLGDLLLAAPSAPRRAEMTWRELLDRYTQRTADGSMAPAIWVDAAWLADEGFSLEDAIPTWVGENPVEAATALLSAARLVIVVQGDVVFLTSLDGLARQLSTWETTASPCVVIARPNSQLSIGPGWAQDRPLPGVVPLAAWIGTPGFPSPPWVGHRDATRSGVAGRPWRVCELPVDDSGRCALTVEHSKSLWVVGWSLLLAVAGIVGGWGRHLRRYLYRLLVAAAVMSLLVPSGLVPITSSLFPGILLGIVIAGFMQRRTARQEIRVTGRSDAVLTTAKVATIVLFAVGLMLLRVRVLHAVQPQENAPTSIVDTVYQVVIPVDATFAPVGQYDYLPLEFYDALHLRASQQGNARHEWFLRQATYRAVFNWRQQRSALDLTTITAVYQLQVLRTQGRLEFPWDGQPGGVELLEARLDGQPIELVWNAARTAFSMRMPAVGTFQLELVLRPEAREEPGQRSLRFVVPPVAQARLQIEVPFGAPSVQVPSAAGSSYVDPESGTQHTEIGPVKQLELRWASGAAENAVPQPMDVQQFMWLKVHPKDQPDAVMLETKFRVQAAARRIEEIKLRVDSRLRLVTEPSSPTYDWTEAPAVDPADGLVTIRLRKPVENELALHLRFHLTNTTGLGNVSLPRLESAEGRTTRRWLAVSVSPDLEFTSGTSDVLSPLDASEFLTMWGEAESAPNLSYRVSAEDPGWSLATRARQPRSESRQTVDLSIGRAGFQFSLDAEIETANGDVYQHRLSVPRTFQVTSVVVMSGETDVAKAVEHDGSGMVTVFLRRGVTGLHRLILRGFQPITDDASPLPLPAVSLTDVAVRSDVVRLYRQSDMWVDVQTPVGLKLIPQVPSGTFHDSYGRLVTAFELNAEGISNIASVTVRLRPNEPRVSARLVTTLHRAGDKWEAIADFDARVASESGGFVDQFRFEIPPEWTGPFSLEPDVPHEIRAIPGQRRHLIIRPWSPVADRFQLRVRGSLKLAANERGRTPNIVPLDVSSAERFFVLPTQLDQQRVDWDTPGLVEVPLGDAVPEGGADAASQVAYRVWSKPRAVIADVQRVAGERRISLADVYLDCQTSGNCFGVVTFAIEPAGTGNCTLEIPEDFDLVHASIDGVPAALVSLADRRWHVRLASEQLPQQLTIAFRGQLAQLRENRPRTIAVPWITDLDVVRTLWTVRGPAGGMLRVPDGDQQRVSAAQQEVLRLRNTASLVASAAETVLDSPARDIQAWYTPWAVRLACDGARIAYTQWLAQRDDSGVDASEIETIYREQEAIAQRLKASPTVMDFVRQTSRNPQSSDIWSFNGHAAAEAAHYDFSGHVPSLLLTWRADTRRSWWSGFWAAVLIAALAAGVHVLATRGVLCEWLQRWPYAVGVLGGIAWWLLAWPSLLGWVIVAVSLWGVVRLPFAAHRLPAGKPDNGVDPTPSGV